MTEISELPDGQRQAVATAREIGRKAQPFAVEHDRAGTFVTEGFQAVRDFGFGRLAVPEELGGGGEGLSTICRAQAAMARMCANTSLAIAMHSHNVLTLAWRWRRGEEALEPVLKRIASEGLIMCSSGTMDLSKPGVAAIAVDGGYRVTGRKMYASGAPGADVLACAAALEGGRIISLLVPLRTEGVTILDNWDVMGMRGSGSNSIEMVDVFVPEDNLIARVPDAGTRRGASGPALDGQRGAHRLPGLLMALPVITAVYLGIASRVRDRALDMAVRGRHADDPVTDRFAGLMTQELRVAWWALDAVIHDTTDDSLLTEDHFITTMLGKRQAVLSAVRVCELATEMLGGMAYFREQPFEQALRDVRAAITHPLAPEATLAEVGRSVLSRRARQRDEESATADG